MNTVDYGQYMNFWKCPMCGEGGCKCLVPPFPPTMRPKEPTPDYGTLVASPISGRTLYANIGESHYLVVWPTGATSHPTLDAAQADARARAADLTQPIYILRPVQKVAAAREVTVTDL